MTAASSKICRWSAPDSNAVDAYVLRDPMAGEAQQPILAIVKQGLQKLVASMVSDLATD
jgi:hypothetical protein